jgi:glutamyl-tRNA reductase
MPGELFVIGVSWRTAPVAVREKLAFRDDEMAGALAQLIDSPSIAEAVILSTCNRVEIYGSLAPSAPTSALASAAAEARSFLARSRGVQAEGLSAELYERGEIEAVRHLFRVASALDSMVVGESQILGQLKDAYGVAVKANATGAILSRSLEKAFAVAKRVRSETGIARGAANVSSVAVELAMHVFGDLVGKRILVVGAGKMSALAARHLRASGAQSIVVVNRTPGRAEALALEIEGVARPWQELERELGLADVVISSTGAGTPILTRDLMKQVARGRRGRPLVVVDIAVPRDVEPAVAKLEGIYLFDIDDLERVVAENLKERQKEATAAAAIVEAEVDEFARWMRSQRVVPTIRSLRDHFNEVAAAEAERAVRALQGGKPVGPEEAERAIRRLAQVIVNKLLHGPMSALKADEHADIDALIAAAQRLFALPAREADAAAADTETAAAVDGRPAGETRRR